MVKETGSMQWVRGLALVILGIIVVMALRGPRDQSGTGRKFPEVELPLLKGGTISTRDLAGKTVVLNFFATWCRPCNMEMPELTRFAQAQDPNKVEVIGISAGDEHRLDIRPFAEHHHIKYPIAIGGEMLLNRLGSSALPTTVVVNPQGEITRMVQGMINEQWLQAAVKEAQASIHGGN